MIRIIKVVDRESIVRMAENWRDWGYKIVLCNGCFDIFHAGHVLLLDHARSLGDVLVVAMNTDRSVRDLKGPGRPLCDERARRMVVGSLECVDRIVMFDETSATDIIKAIRPDVWVKGGDLSLDSIPPDQREALESMGTKIVFVPLLEGYSTTMLVQKAREGQAA